MFTFLRVKSRALRYFLASRFDKRLAIELAVAVVLVIGVSFMAQAGTGSTARVLYSLDHRSNDQEIIQLINDADQYIYFAIYYFTKPNIAEALIRAKKRGLDVQGIMDREASFDSNKKILEMLQSSGIVVETQKHEDGIMHIKAIVTDKAYASGSYNWTAAATESNDEVLEIGANGAVHDQYVDIIKKILKKNGEIDVAMNDDEDRGASRGTEPHQNLPEYAYTEAPDHIGERARVTGTILKVFTSKSGVTFLDFCASISACPFSAVIFAGDRGKFGDVSSYARPLTLTGIIKSYQGKAEMILDDPTQVE